MKLTAEEIILVFALFGALLIGASMRQCTRKPTPIPAGVRQVQTRSIPTHEGSSHAAAYHRQTHPLNRASGHWVKKI
jgi:hypothetical protein